MFEVAWSELLVVALVALVVLGPKELPKLFRTFGQFTGKLRKMSREFSRAMEEAAEDAGVNDVVKTARSVSSPGRAIRDAVGLDDIERDLRSATSAASTTSTAARKAATGSTPVRAAGIAAGSTAATAASGAALASAPEEEADDEEYIRDLEAPSDIETQNASVIRAAAAAQPTAPNGLPAVTPDRDYGPSEPPA